MKSPRAGTKQVQDPDRRSRCDQVRFPALSPVGSSFPMRNHILLLLAIATPAAAQPVTQPSPCEVTISRAPDDVREAIEAWVKAEPRCATTLDVRVIPTDGGFYLLARDGAGRVRERVVPDAQSAGVLVASWAADDGIAPPSTTPPPVEAVVPPAAPRHGATVPAAPAAIAPPGVVATARPDRTNDRWLTLGGIVQMHGDGAGGARAELDLLRRGPWTLGAVLAGSAAHLTLDAGAGYLSTVDIRLVGALARTSSIGRRWDMRLAFGAGVMSTYATGELDGVKLAANGVFPTAEASLVFARGLGGGWAIAMGPIVTWYSQTYKLRDNLGAMTTLSRRDLEVMAFGGIRRRL